MQQRPSRAQIQRDVITGTRPAIYFAVGIGVVTGGSTTIVMVIAALMVISTGGIAVGTSFGMVQLLGVSIGFWLGVSFSVILGVTVGFRSWVALYPAYERRTATAEQRAAVEEAEALLRSPRTHEE
jgi:hypothetical protein